MADRLGRVRRGDDPPAWTVGLLVAMALGCFFGAVALAGLLFQYNLWNLVGKDVPWYADAVGGLVLNGANFVVAVVVWIAKLAGVPTPFFTP